MKVGRKTEARRREREKNNKENERITVVCNFRRSIYM